MPMYYATDVTGELVEAKEAAKGAKGKGKPPYHCEECSVELFPVSEFFRRTKYAEARVEAFFRLPKNTPHDATCDYNVRGQLAQLAAKYQSKYIKQLPDGTFVFDIVLPGARSRTDGNPRNAKPWARATEPFISDEDLLAYINSAMGVLELQSRLVEDVDMREHIQLRFNSQPLDWEDFFYDRPDHLRCYDYVKSTNGEYPVAVLGTVQERKIVKKDGKKSALLSLVKPLGHPRPTRRAGVHESYSLSMWSQTLDAFDEFEPGDPIMMFGYWSAVEEEKPNTRSSQDVRTYLNKNLYFRPLIRAQFCIAKPLHARQPRRFQAA